MLGHSLQACEQVEDIRRAAEQAASRAQEDAMAAAQRQAQVASSLDVGNLRQQLLAAIQSLQRGLVERETEARLLLLAALSNEHILFIGPPGTAKSEMGRRLSGLVDGPFFERLLTRFSVPEVRQAPACRIFAHKMHRLFLFYADFKASIGLAGALWATLNASLARRSVCETNAWLFAQCQRCLH